MKSGGKVASLIVTVGLLMLSAVAQSAYSASQFDSFFAKFKSSVMGADTYTLQSLMSPSFDYLGSSNASPTEVFKGLHSANGWDNLQSAVQKKAIVDQDYRGKPARVLRCTPDNPTNNCLVVFQTDSSGHWKWTAMVMPEKWGRAFTWDFTGLLALQEGFLVREVNQPD
jgi:hypothetical protein